MALEHSTLQNDVQKSSPHSICEQTAKPPNIEPSPLGLSDAQLQTVDDVLSLTTALGDTSLLDKPQSGLVDNLSDVAMVMDAIKDLPTTPPSLFIDLEGTNLSSLGSISIMQLHVAPKARTYLIDVHKLQKQAFLTRGSKGQCLKEILELAAIPKVFYDVRNDSDALYSHFGIDLAGVQDIQLMELATRDFSRKFVSGLGKCVENDLRLSPVEKVLWKETKEQGLKLFAPERGGSYEIFKERPLAPAIVQYCMQDVQYLPKLWNIYHSRLSRSWSSKVEKATKARVRDSQSAGYVSQGRQKALGPWR